MGYLIFLLSILAIVVLLRMVADRLDRDRICRYIEERGGRVDDISWTPFGPGWFGEKSDRIYSVVYFDKDNNRHRASCKTGLWTSVYFTEDTSFNPSVFSLEEENRRLRAEIERLKRQGPQS